MQRHELKELRDPKRNKANEVLSPKKFVSYFEVQAKIVVVNEGIAITSQRNQCTTPDSHVAVRIKVLDIISMEL